MDRTALAILIFFLAGCGQKKDVPAKVTRNLTPSEKAEQRKLFDETIRYKDPDELVGKTRADFSREFELADVVYEYQNGDRGYGFEIRSGIEEQEALLSDVFIRTDGGRPLKEDRAKDCQETILKVYISVPAS